MRKPQLPDDPMETTQTLIVGGGLTGLAIAQGLEAAGHDYLLVEARSRFGGRVMSQPHGDTAFDLGPSWFWPGQPRMASLARALGVRRFDQFATGDLMFETRDGQTQRGVGFSSMEGSWRLAGGMAALTDGLVARIPEHKRRKAMSVAAVNEAPDGLQARFASGDQISAQRVILALPPRLAAEIVFAPALPDLALTQMRGVPTWMAGQAKVVAVYTDPFWRKAGLSGDAMSQHGPLVEIHDASPSDGGPYALFGFVGVPPQARRDESLLREAIIAQLARIFGPQAQKLEALYLKDWAFDAQTAVDADHLPLRAHPTYGKVPSLKGIWQDRLIFAGTETAPEFGGYLEGALASAEEVLAQILGIEKDRRYGA